MYKKELILSTLLLLQFALCSAMISNTSLTIPAYYEQIIAREYNRINGLNTYNSINTILNQSLEGKSTLQKTQVMNSLKALKTAVEVALSEAQNNGKRLWYWFYLFKDNDAVIDLLSRLNDKVNTTINAYEWEMRWDITKAGWYTAKSITIAALGIITLYASRNYIRVPDNTPFKEIQLHQLLAAPILAGYDVLKSGMKHGLEWGGYFAKKTGQGADSLENWIFAHKINLEK